MNYKFGNFSEDKIEAELGLQSGQDDNIYSQNYPKQDNELVPEINVASCIPKGRDTHQRERVRYLRNYVFHEASVPPCHWLESTVIQMCLSQPSKNRVKIRLRINSDC